MILYYIHERAWFKKGISSDFNFTFEKIPNPGDPKFLNLPEKLKNIFIVCIVLQENKRKYQCDK